MTKFALLVSPFLSLGRFVVRPVEEPKNLEVLGDLLEEAQNILEIGGGHGELVQEILDLRPNQPKISVVESEKDNLVVLREKFGCNVRLSSEDILSAQLGKDFDLALWMTGMEDLNFEDQFVALRNINSQMAWGGILAIDLFANVSTQQQVIRLAKLSGFIFQTPRYYSSESGETRVIYLLKKSCI